MKKKTIIIIASIAVVIGVIVGIIMMGNKSMPTYNINFDNAPNHTELSITSNIKNIRPNGSASFNLIIDKEYQMGSLQVLSDGEPISFAQNRTGSDDREIYTYTLNDINKNISISFSGEVDRKDIAVTFSWSDYVANGLLNEQSLDIFNVKVEKIPYNYVEGSDQNQIEEVNNSTATQFKTDIKNQTYNKNYKYGDKIVISIFANDEYNTFVDELISPEQNVNLKCNYIDITDLKTLSARYEIEILQSNNYALKENAIVNSNYLASTRLIVSNIDANKNELPKFELVNQEKQTILTYEQLKLATSITFKLSNVKPIWKEVLTNSQLSLKINNDSTFGFSEDSSDLVINDVRVPYALNSQLAWYEIVINNIDNILTSNSQFMVKTVSSLSTYFYLDKSQKIRIGDNDYYLNSSPIEIIIGKKDETSIIVKLYTKISNLPNSYKKPLPKDSQIDELKDSNDNALGIFIQPYTPEEGSTFDDDTVNEYLITVSADAKNYEKIEVSLE